MELILWIITGLVIAGGALTALRGSGGVVAVGGALHDHSVRKRQADDQRALVEAVATWTENLRDTISASSGLEQAIIATELHAPRAISAPVRRLVASLRYGSLEDGLRRFADDVAHPTVLGTIRFSRGSGCGDMYFTVVWFRYLVVATNCSNSNTSKVLVGS